MSLLRKIFYRHMSNEKRIDILRKSGIKIGSGCEIFNDVEFGSEPYLITIGNNVRVTNGVKFVTHDGGIWVLRKMNKLPDADIFARIKIGNNVHIGWNSIIMPNVTIGDNCIIGCGAIVTKSIPDNSIAVGIPAKVIKSIDEYYEQHKDSVDFTKHMLFDEKKKYLYEKFNLCNRV